jgi:hypothetical protein
MGLPMILKVTLLIALILDLASLLVPLLLLLVMDLLLNLFLVMTSLVVIGELLLNGLLVIKPVVAIVDDLQFVLVCLDTPQPLPLMNVILIQIINMTTSMTIVPDLVLLIVVKIKMIAVITNQPVANLPTVTEEMVAIKIHQLPLKIVKVVNL